MVRIKDNKHFVFVILFLVIQMFVCVLVGINKKNLFCDEVFTYGLANCGDCTFLNKKTFSKMGYNGWLDSDFLRHYVDVDTENPLSFKPAYENQVADVHPPLYYFFIHIMCLLLGGTFTKWSGLVLNLFILVGIDFVLYKIGKFIFQDNRIKAVFPIVFWSFSSAGLSNVAFIRMYLLLTLEVLLFVAVHIEIIKNLNKCECGKIFNAKRLALLALTIICGGLTHYYFYPFAFFFGASVSIIHIAWKKVKSLCVYILTMLIAFGFNLLVFPGTVQHVFNRARGNEVLSNLGGRSGSVYPEYIGMIDQSLFGGCLLILVIVLGIMGLVIAIKQRRKKTNATFCGEEKKEKGLIALIKRSKSENTMFAIICISTYCFLIIAIQGSQLITNRYIWQVYPFLALITVKLMYQIAEKFLGDKRVAYTVVGCSLLFFCVLSIYRYGIEYLYSDYDEEIIKTADLKGCDCLIYNKDDWVDIYTTFFISLDYDETYLIKPKEMDLVKEIVDGRRTNDKLVVWVPTLVNEEDTVDFLNRVVHQLAYREYVFRTDYLRMQVFELIR